MWDKIHRSIPLVIILIVQFELKAGVDDYSSSEIFVIGKRPRIIPGQWEFTRGNIYQYSPGVRRPFKPLPGYKLSVCMPDENVNPVMRILLGDGKEIDKLGRCDLSKVVITGEKIKGGYSCKISMGPDIRKSIVGKISRDRMAVFISATAETGNGRTYFNSRASAKRIGECE